MAQVVAFPDGSEIFSDPRGEGRALRVHSHHDDGFVVLSLWRDEQCIATARVRSAEVPSLIATLVDGLAAGASTNPIHEIHQTRAG
ncbi:MAG TPA: hypothetical protein VGH11_08865 [Jatrophihabitans sp.]|jgi:hypothetical protein